MIPSRSKTLPTKGKVEVKAKEFAGSWIQHKEEICDRERAEKLKVQRVKITSKTCNDLLFRMVVTGKVSQESEETENSENSQRLHDLRFRANKERNSHLWITGRTLMSPYLWDRRVFQVNQNSCLKLLRVLWCICRSKTESPTTCLLTMPWLWW